MKTRLLFITVAFLLLYNNTNAQSTAGTLTFKFTSPIHTSGNYRSDGKYLVAVWIETNPTTGTSAFVKTKLKYGSSGNYDHLATWSSKSGQSVVDATSGGTTSSIFTANTISWNGTNVAGTVVADGSYRVAIQETWSHSAASVTRYFPFVKGVAMDMQTPTADTNFTTISLQWMPTALAVNEFSSSLNPKVTIYPNPTNGVFNMDFKNDVKSIRVVDILGKVVYSEKIASESVDTTKRIDLSNLNNGLYIVSVTNDNGTSNYKVILNK